MKISSPYAVLDVCTLQSNIIIFKIRFQLLNAGKPYEADRPLDFTGYSFTGELSLLESAA